MDSVILFFSVNYRILLVTTSTILTEFSESIIFLNIFDKLSSQKKALKTLGIINFSLTQTYTTVFVRNCHWILS